MNVAFVGANAAKQTGVPVVVSVDSVWQKTEVKVGERRRHTSPLRWCKFLAVWGRGRRPCETSPVAEPSSVECEEEPCFFCSEDSFACFFDFK